MKKLYFSFAVLLIAVSSAAQETVPFREKQINFIKELYENGRYFDCIGETGKLHLNKKTPSMDYFIFSNYYLAGQYTTVINNYTADLSSDDTKFHSLLLLSGSFLKEGMYFESYQILKNTEYRDLSDKYMFTMFLRRIEPLVLSAESDRIDLEIKESEKFLEDNYNFIKLREELQLYKSDGLKSPAFAALMSSALPGLGQVYSGYPVEGLISLLSVVATAAGGLYMRSNDRKGFSYTLFFFSGLFYSGNIYGAYNSAESANREVLHDRHNRITAEFGSYNPGDYIEFESVFN